MRQKSCNYLNNPIFARLLNKFLTEIDDKMRCVRIERA